MSLPPINALVLERFPEHVQIISRLHEENDDFRELCDHFAECCLVLGRLRTSSAANQQRVDEYDDLTSDLEREIRTLIQAAVQTD
jgi:hypothetical protein